MPSGYPVNVVSSGGFPVTEATEAQGGWPIEETTLPAFPVTVVSSGGTPVLFTGAVDPLAFLQSKGAEFFYHDFVGRTDLTFQEAGGNTAADDAAEPVGLALGSDVIGDSTLSEYLAAQTELLSTGTTGLVGTATAATYDTGTGAGSVTRVTFPTDQSYVTFPVTSGKMYRLDATGAGASIAVRSSTAGSVFVFLGASRTVSYIVATSSEIVFTAGANATVSFTVHSLKEVEGNYAIQGASTSYRMIRQADGSLRTDGLDDHLRHTLNPAASGTILQRSKFNSTSGTQFLIGSQSSSTTQRAAIAMSGGNLLARIGPNDAINSAAAAHTDYAVTSLSWGESGDTARLYRDGAEIGSVLQTGTLASVYPLWSGILNSAGTLSSPASIDITHQAYIAAKLTRAEIAAIAKAWNAS